MQTEEMSLGTRLVHEWYSLVLFLFVLLHVSPVVLFQSSRTGLRVGDLFGDPQVLEKR